MPMPAAQSLTTESANGVASQTSSVLSTMVKIAELVKDPMMILVVVMIFFIACLVVYIIWAEKREKRFLISLLSDNISEQVSVLADEFDKTSEALGQLVVLFHTLNLLRQGGSDDRTRSGNSGEARGKDNRVGSAEGSS